MLSQNPDEILKRIINVKQVLKDKLAIETDKDEREFIEMDIKSINKLFDSLADYTKAAFVDEEKNANLKGLMERCKDIEEYHYKFEEIEKSRKMKHDKLIISLKMADQICELNGVEPIYGELGKYKNDTSELLDMKNYSKPRYYRNKEKNRELGF